EFVVGSMLGDGNLDYTQGTRTESCRLRFCHGIKQLEYIKWKKEILSNLVQQNIVIYEQKTRNSVECSIQTINHPDFIGTHKIFYNGKIKIIPSNIEELLTNFGLAVWLMDDGWKRKEHRTMKLCTDSFSFSDQEKLLEAL